MVDADFRLKGSVVTVIVIELYRYTADTFVEQLEQQIQRSPQLFDQAPVVISLEKFSVDESLPEFNLLLEQCRACGLLPVAFRDQGSRFLKNVQDTGLSLLPRPASRGKTPPAAKTAPGPDTKQDMAIKTEAKKKPSIRPSKLVTRPVRSGQQIYADGADLIVLAAVNEGAEVLADGNIHIYGPLRGRALAGIRGDDKARIFCQKMDAELISIAGNFLLSDALDEKVRRQPAHAFLQDDTLCVAAL